jgi:transcriptional regulator with XRE-family HTH domain
MANNLKQIRETQELSPATLAALIGISTFELQKIEEDVTPLRLSDAYKLAQVLEITLDQLIPGLGDTVIPEVSVKRGRSLRLPQKFLTLLRNNRVDTDPRYNYIKLVFNNGMEQLFDIDGFDKERLLAILEQEPSESSNFMVFNSSTSRIIVNLDCIAMCHFLYEPNKDRKTMMRSDNVVKAFLRGRCDVIYFPVEPDSIPLTDGPEYDWDCQLQNIVLEAESQPNKGKRFYFEDDDGEVVFVTWSELSLLEIPLNCVEPSLEVAI